MIEIVEQLLDPIRILATSNLMIGSIITLSYNKDDVYCTLSNSLNPLGIVVGSYDQWGMVPILCDMAIIKLDTYEKAEDYNIGDSLYSNNFGQLTKNKYHNNSLLLGHIINPPSKDNPVMEINWI